MYNPIDEQFKDYLKRYGVTVTNSDQLINGFFREIKDERGINLYFYSMESIDTNDYIVAEDATYIIRSKEMVHGSVYTRYFVKTINHIIKTYIDGEYIEIPTLIDRVSNTLDENQYMVIVDGVLMAIVPMNNTNKLIDRIIFSDSLWEKVGYFIDTDVIIYSFEKGAFGTSDDRENEITNIPDEPDEPDEPSVEGYSVDNSNTRVIVTMTETFNWSRVDGVSTTFTFSIDPTTTASSGDYIFTVIDSDSYSIRGEEQSYKDVVVKIRDNSNGFEFTQPYRLVGYY